MPPVDPERRTRLARDHGTPLPLRRGSSASAWSSSPRSTVVRYAQKACFEHPHPAPAARRGHVVDAVSLGESRARAAAPATTAPASPGPGLHADLCLDERDLARVSELGIPVNAGSPDMLEQLGRKRPPPHLDPREPGLRPRPSRKTNTGGPLSNTASGTSTRRGDAPRREVPARPHRAPHAHRLGHRPRAPEAGVRGDGRAGAHARRGRAARFRAAAACDPYRSSDASFDTVARTRSGIRRDAASSA